MKIWEKNCEKGQNCEKKNLKVKIHIMNEIQFFGFLLFIVLEQISTIVENLVTLLLSSEALPRLSREEES